MRSCTTLGRDSRPYQHREPRILGELIEHFELLDSNCRLQPIGCCACTDFDVTEGDCHNTLSIPIEAQRSIPNLERKLAFRAAADRARIVRSVRVVEGSVDSSALRIGKRDEAQARADRLLGRIVRLRTSLEPNPALTPRKPALLRSDAAIPLSALRMFRNFAEIKDVCQAKRIFELLELFEKFAGTSNMLKLATRIQRLRLSNNAVERYILSLEFQPAVKMLPRPARDAWPNLQATMLDTIAATMRGLPGEFARPRRA